jgi:hypothetical protein
MSNRLKSPSPFYCRLLSLQWLTRHLPSPLSIALGQWPGPLVQTSRLWRTRTFQAPAWIPLRRPPIADLPISKRLLLISTPAVQLRSPTSLLLTFRSTSTCNFASLASARPDTAHGVASIHLNSRSTTIQWLTSTRTSQTPTGTGHFLRL